MRHYYLTRSGRLSRQDNTLLFEPVAQEDEEPSPLPPSQPDDDEAATATIAEDFNDLTGNFGASASDFGTLATPPLSLILPPSSLDEPPVLVRERRVIPVADVDAFWVFREADLNARVLNFLAQNKIPVHFFNYYGYYSGTFYPREYLQAGYVLLRQVRHYSNKRLRLALAREFIDAGLHNILRNLRYYETRGTDLQAQTAIVQAERLRLPQVKNIGELMSCEGRARAAYYQGFSPILRGTVEFTKRVRRPPDNMVNALISFTNGLVYAATLSQIYRSQLDPTISFLHEPGYRRFSLALDLAEVFKPVLADRLLFKMLNTKQLNERDFAQDLNCCYLKPAGRKTVLQAWEARLQTTIEHRRLKRKVSYQRLLRLECYKLVKHLLNDEPYTGFKAWW